MIERIGRGVLDTRRRWYDSCVWAGIETTNALDDQPVSTPATPRKTASPYDPSSAKLNAIEQTRRRKTAGRGGSLVHSPLRLDRAFRTPHAGQDRSPRPRQRSPAVLRAVRRAHLTACHSPRDKLGVQRGDRVAVLALNTTDTLEVQFACGRIGAVFLPLNTRLTVPELQFIVGDASPKVMIHDTDLAEAALTVAKLCNVSSALLLGPGGSYEAAIAASTPLDHAEVVTLDDISTIIYTSGTTGLPKGAIITHGMTFWNCVNLGASRIRIDGVPRTAAAVSHRRPKLFSYPVFQAGGTVLIMRNFDPGEALR